MRKRFYGALLALGMGGALVAFSPMAAEAACAGSQCTSAGLTAVLNGSTIGSRSIVSVTPGSFSTVGGNATLATPLTTVVAEAAVAGDANWSVTSSSTDFSDGASHTISATDLANSGNTTTVVGGDAAAKSEGSSAGNQSGAGQTLFSSSGENTQTLYTGTYTDVSSLTLTPPNGTFAAAAGTTYSATLTVTLFT